MTSLLLPKSVKVDQKLWKKRRRSRTFHEQIKRFAWSGAAEQPKEHPGKKYGAPTGGWIWDLVERRKAIILCDGCQPKFDHKKAGYYKDRRFPYVVGKCDGCRTWMNHRTKLYIHESFLGEPNGYLRAGQSWTAM